MNVSPNQPADSSATCRSDDGGVDSWLVGLCLVNAAFSVIALFFPVTVMIACPITALLLAIHAFKRQSMHILLLGLWIPNAMAVMALIMGFKWASFSAYSGAFLLFYFFQVSITFVLSASVAGLPSDRKQGRTGPARRFHFCISDLLLATALVAIVLGSIRMTTMLNIHTWGVVYAGIVHACTVTSIATFVIMERPKNKFPSSA